MKIIIILIFYIVLGFFSGCNKAKKDTPSNDITTNAGVDQLPGLPPDPGDAGKKTLEGIDADGDGLRDDIQRWIAVKFPNSEKTRAALKQLAIDHQEGLKIVDDRKLSIEATRRKLDSSGCFIYVMENIMKASNPKEDVIQRGIKISNIREAMEAQISNTYERSKARIKVSTNFNGQFYKLPNTKSEERALCRFNIDKMPN